jgi:flavin-binding protein dodecin
MAEHVYRVTELVGTSQESIEDAIRTGISRANQTVRNMDWFEVTEIRGYIREGELHHYQVGMKLGFKLEDA